MISSQMIGKITKVGLMINRLKMEKNKQYEHLSCAVIFNCLMMTS